MAQKAAVSLRVAFLLDASSSCVCCFFHGVGFPESIWLVACANSSSDKSTWKWSRMRVRTSASLISLLLSVSCRNRGLFSQLFLCLSRACLGKMIVLTIKLNGSTDRRSFNFAHRLLKHLLDLQFVLLVRAAPSEHADLHQHRPKDRHLDLLLQRLRQLGKIRREINVKLA